MKKRVVDLRGQSPLLLDIVSYGRGGSGRLTQAQINQISRTVGRNPEVMVKVSGGARRMRGVGSHLSYIGREGDLEMETDMGDRVQQKGFQRALTKDWDLDLDAHWHPSVQNIRGQRKSPKLVHNIIFSMSPGTPSQKVLKAVKKLATEEWVLEHRYAMVLHTDDAHPHVHLVLKATSERGERLNIRKATLRAWRHQFATNLRELDVAANATERAVRGATQIRKSDGAFRAAQRGASILVPAIRPKPVTGMAAQPSSTELLEPKRWRTRNAVIAGWRNVSDKLRTAGRADLSDRVDEFVEQMSRTKIERQSIHLDAKPIDRSQERKIEPIDRFR